MQSLVLYNAPQSTCSQRVRFTLHEKNLAFSELRLDLFSGDQLRPEYLKINPNGVVPSLIHNGRVIIDSAVIIEYLSEVFTVLQFRILASLSRHAGGRLHRAG